MYQREPDLILANGKFVTLDPQGRIVTGLASRVLDLEGRTVIPGIVDSRCHPGGASKSSGPGSGHRRKGVKRLSPQ